MVVNWKLTFGTLNRCQRHCIYFSSFFFLQFMQTYFIKQNCFFFVLFTHCVKYARTKFSITHMLHLYGKTPLRESVQIRSYFWYVFSCIRTEYGEILRISPFQSECGKIPTRNNSLFGNFSHSARVRENPCSRLFYAVITS